jgi:hypothetical protein
MTLHIHSLVACCFALLVPAIGLAEMPNAPIYGPERNAYINMKHSFRIGVPARHKLTVTVRTNAFNENACFIYDDTGRTVLKRGNYLWQLNPNTFVFENNSSVDRHFRVAAWHKNSQPRGGEPWYSSSMKVFQSDRTQGMFGFEDLILAANQTKYNDQIVEYRLEPIRTLGKRKK